MAPEPVVRLEGIRKTFRDGAVVGLDTVNLDIEAGEFLTLLGPSGCGKTTSLRIVAGFEQPTSGRVLLDGRDITAEPPYARPVNTVFQDYALFPHMTVGENVGFGLTTRQMASAEIKRRTGEVLDLVGLADRTAERVTALSGGQRQRVALARAIVCRPRVLLLDEPLSALDAHLREQMQIELKRLQTELGTTFVMVTHDQTEALSISDRIVVMNRGRIEQSASPADLYDRPATTFVASFIGTMNLIEAEVRERRGGDLLAAAGPLVLTLSAADTQPDAAGRLTVGLRPEDVVLSGSPGEGAAPGEVSGTVFHGRSLRVHVTLAGGQAITVDLPRTGAVAALARGALVYATARPGAARALARS